MCPVFLERALVLLNGKRFLDRMPDSGLGLGEFRNYFSRTVPGREKVGNEGGDDGRDERDEGGDPADPQDDMRGFDDGRSNGEDDKGHRGQKEES